MKRFIKRLHESTRGLTSKSPEFDEDFPTLPQKKVGANNSNRSQKSIADSDSLFHENEAFRLIVFYRTKSLYVGSILAFLLNVFVTSAISYFSSEEFTIAYYYTPYCFILLFIWTYIQKSPLSLNHQLSINIFSFFLFGSAFAFLYAYIFSPIISQTFQHENSCKLLAIIPEVTTTLTKTDSSLSAATIISKAAYSIIAASYLTREGTTAYACGCISSKFEDSSFSRNPNPYQYTSRGSDRYNLSEKRMPSWLCSENLMSITGLSESEINMQISASTYKATAEITLNQCFVNHHLGSTLVTTYDDSLCVANSVFPQVIFNEQPYFEKWFLHVVIIILYTPFFAYSFNWVTIIFAFSFRRRFCRRRKTNSMSVSPMPQNNHHSNEFASQNLSHAKRDSKTKSNSSSSGSTNHHARSASSKASVRSKQLSHLNANNPLNDSTSINLDQSNIDNSIIDHKNRDHSQLIKPSQPQIPKSRQTIALPPLRNNQQKFRNRIGSHNGSTTPI